MLFWKPNVPRATPLMILPSQGPCHRTSTWMLGHVGVNVVFGPVAFSSFGPSVLTLVDSMDP